MAIVTFEYKRWLLRILIQIHFIDESIFYPVKGLFLRSIDKDSLIVVFLSKDVNISHLSIRKACTKSPPPPNLTLNVDV